MTDAVGNYLTCVITPLSSANLSSTPMALKCHFPSVIMKLEMTLRTWFTVLCTLHSLARIENPGVWLTW